MTNKMNKIRAIKIIAASLLGDGNVSIPPDGSINALYRQPKIYLHEDYCIYIKEALEYFTSVKLRRFQPKILNAKEQIEIKSKVHPIFTKLRKRMYPNGHKVVCPHLLKFIDWEFLAVLYQEDGCTVKDVRKSNTYIRVIICSESFSYADNHLLRTKFKEYLGIEFNVKSIRNRGNQGYRLELNKNDINKFMNGIEPFISKSFRYKICRTVSSSSVLDEEIVRT